MIELIIKNILSVSEDVLHRLISWEEKMSKKVYLLVIMQDDVQVEQMLSSFLFHSNIDQEDQQRKWQRSLDRNIFQSAQRSIDIVGFHSLIDSLIKTRAQYRATIRNEQLNKRTKHAST